MKRYVVETVQYEKDGNGIRRVLEKNFFHHKENAELFAKTELRYLLENEGVILSEVKKDGYEFIEEYKRGE